MNVLSHPAVGVMNHLPSTMRISQVVVAFVALAVVGERGAAQPVSPPPTPVDPCSTVGLEPSLFRQLIEREFVGLVGTPANVPGAFGALEIDKDQKATLSASSQPGNGRVFTLTASGGVDNGILSFINSRQSATTFSVGARVDFLGHRPPDGKGAWSEGLRLRDNAIQYDLASCHAYLAATAKAHADHAERVSRIDADAQNIAKKFDVQREAHRLDSIVALHGILLPARIAENIAALQLAKTADEQRPIRARLQMDSLKLDSLRFDIATTRKRKELAENRFIPTDQAQRMVVNAQHATELTAAQQLIKVMGYRLGWATVGFTIDNVAFKLFNPSVPFDVQVTSRTNVTPKLTFAYSEYSLDASTDNTYFWTAALKLGVVDNLDQLSKVELSETKQFGETADARSSTRKVNAYQGEYTRDITTATVSFDTYRFVFGNNQAAWHLFPAVEYRENSRPIYSAGLGYLWVAKRKGDGFLNAELFYALNDIGEATASPDNVWERSRVGLRVAFPFSFAQR